SASRDADARAFGALMAHLKAVDGARRTVIMVQVENEAGTLGADRDHAPAADALFRAAVPADMPGAKPGDWTANYGVRAPEAFMAYHPARYIGAVAAAGKRAYDL
ncbi:beta-galactosidase, partial [Serratia marcescens]|nr:beta-galactosidase [Serratia marcescens]